MAQGTTPEEFEYTPSAEDRQTFYDACDAILRGEEEPAPEVSWVCSDCQKEDCSDDYCGLSDDVWNAALRPEEDRKG